MSKYPNIKKLGLKIIKKPTSHIPSGELRAILSKNNMDVRVFNAYFGIHTCLKIEDGKYKGQNGLYPCDVENILAKMMKHNM